MSVVSAEKSFNKGLVAFIDRNYVEATMYFRRAMDIEKRRQVLQPDMRYLSYYGLCHAKAHSKIEGGIYACKRAAQVRKRDPQMYLNLGRVYLMARLKRQAYRAFQAGLEIEPDHRILSLESARVAKQLPRHVLRDHSDGFLAKVWSALSRPVNVTHSR